MPDHDRAPAIEDGNSSKSSNSSLAIEDGRAMRFLRDYIAPERWHNIRPSHDYRLFADLWLSHLRDAVAEYDRLAAELRELRQIVQDVADDVECDFDHHGYCQTHGWMETVGPCPIGRANELISTDGTDA